MKDIAVEYIIEKNDKENLSKENCNYIADILRPMIESSNCDIAAIKIYSGKQINLDKDILRTIRASYKTLFIFLSGARGAFSKTEHFSGKNIDYLITHSNIEFADFLKSQKKSTIAESIFSTYPLNKNAIIFNSVYNIPLSQLGEELVTHVQDQFASMLKPIDEIKSDNMEDLKNYIQSVLDSTSENISKKISELKSSIGIEELHLSEHYRTLAKLEEEYKIDRDKKAQKVQHLLSLLRDGVNLKGIESIQPVFEQEGIFKKLEIITDKVYINSMGYKFYVGRFKIDLDFSNTKTTIINLEPENRRKSYWGNHCQHPHVSETGDPCLGACAPPLAEAMKGFQIKTICMLLLSYLSSINAADAAGKHLTNWDIVDGNGNILDFPKELKPCSTCSQYVTEITKDGFAICHDCGENFCSNHHDKYQIEGEKEPVALCTDCRRSYKTCEKCGILTKSTEICSYCGGHFCEEHIRPFRVILGDIDEHGRYRVTEQYVCSDCENDFLQNVTQITCEHCGDTFYSFGTVEHYVCNICADNSCSFCGKELTGTCIEIGGEKICKECFKTTGNCQCCQKRFAKEDLHDVRGGLFCAQCLEDAGIALDGTSLGDTENNANEEDSDEIIPTF